MKCKNLATPYRSSQIAIDERRAADAGIQGNQARYLEQVAAQRMRAETERGGFWTAAQLLADRKPVDDATLDLAVAYVERHGENVPPTLRWEQIPGYRIARARIRTAERARADVMSADEVG